MATISNTLSLQDKITPTLTKAQKAAIQNIQTFNQMDESIKSVKKAMEDAEKANPKIVNTEMYSQAVEGLEAMEGKLYDVANGTDNLKAKNKGLSMSITELNQGLELLHKGWSALSSVMSEAMEWAELSNNQFNSEYTSAVKMHSVLGASEEEINSMYEYASALQQVGVVGDEATLAGVSSLSLYASNYDQVKQLIPAILDYTVTQKGLDATQSDVASSAEMIGRALNGTTTFLARSIGMTEEESNKLEKMNNKTERAAYLTEILEKRFGGANEQLAKTAQGGIKQADNALGDLGETLGFAVTPYISAFKQAIVNLLAPAVQWIADNMNIIAPIFLTLAGVIGAVIIALTLYSVWCGIAALAEMGILWPILAIIAAVLIVIGLINLMVSAVNQITGNTISATGIIMSVIFALAAFIYNSFIVPVWNAIAMLVNFFANCFRDPIASIKILFLDLANTVIKILGSIASVIDFIFGSNLAATVNNWSAGINSMKEQIKQESGYVEVMGSLDNWDYTSAAISGYKFGSNLSSGISSGMANLNLENMLSGLDGIQGSFDDIVGLDSTGSSAVKTTSNDDLLSDDDIQLLLDVATRDYKLNYQQVTPNITLTFGDIRETADVDEVIEEVADRLEEIYNGNLEV